MAGRRRSYSPGDYVPATSYAQRCDSAMSRLQSVAQYPATIFGPTTLKRISQKLDPHDHWKELAEKMGFSNDEIYEVSKKNDRAGTVIERGPRMGVHYTVRDMINLIHDTMRRQDVFTDEEIVQQILSDAQRHDRSQRRTLGRSHSQPGMTRPWIAPPLNFPSIPEATAFHGLNTASFIPSYAASTFYYPASGLDLYGPGQSQLVPDSATSPGQRTSALPTGSPVEYLTKFGECINQDSPPNKFGFPAKADYTFLPRRGYSLPY